MKIDALDLEIIKYLQDNARMSFREIGKKLGVPHTTVFTRAEKLLERGVIKKFSAVLHPHELGLQIGYVIVDAPPAESRKIANKIAQHEEARKIYRTFDGKILVNTLVPETRQHQGMEEFLARIDVHPMTVYAINDIVKYDNTLTPDTLKSILSDKK